MEIKDIKYEYITDENNNHTVKEIYKNFTNTVTKDSNENVIYQNINGVELKKEIKYKKDYYGIETVDEIKNNFGTVFKYDKDSELLEESVNGNNIRRYEHGNWKSDPVYLEYENEYLNGELNQYTLTKHIQDGESLSKIINYNPGFSDPEESFILNLHSALNHTDREIEQIHSDYIYEKIKDSKGNVLSEKCYKCINKIDHTYDELNNETEAKYYDNEDLIRIEKTDIKYNEEMLPLFKRISIYDKNDILNKPIK